jgi:hypothetical protein
MELVFMGETKDPHKICVKWLMVKYYFKNLGVGRRI